TTPSLATLRSALVDTEIGGARVRKGDRIVLATYKANRQRGPWDPTSDRVAGLKQLWFGAGEHFCIGAPLAMAQIRTAITALRSVEGR
ncbi:MAG: cytochrome P450, partial [Agrococcus casei]